MWKREKMKENRIVVLMGGRSAERDVSLQSGDAVLSALKNRGYDAVGVDVGGDLCSQIANIKAQVAFIALHGRYGEDGCVQGFLETQGIPYTGASVLASAMAMDKVVSKRLFEMVGVNTPRWCLADKANWQAACDLGFPLVVKPRAEGSSVNLFVVHDETHLKDALTKFEEPALVEAYVAGHELSFAVLGAGEQARCLGSVEIKPKNGLYDYQAKYESDDTEYLVPAPIPKEVSAKCETMALAAHRILECSGATRVDFRWDEKNDPVVLELNTLPGMTSHSLLPKIAAHQGMPYDELVEQIVFDAGVKA